MTSNKGRKIKTIYIGVNIIVTIIILKRKIFYKKKQNYEINLMWSFSLNSSIEIKKKITLPTYIVIITTSFMINWRNFQ